MCRSKCTHCQTALEEVELSPAEFRLLTDTFVEQAFVRGDIFHNTSPQEFERFQKFLKTTEPFDIVVDGLNMSSRRTQSIVDRCNKVRLTADC